MVSLRSTKIRISFSHLPIIITHGLPVGRNECENRVLEKRSTSELVREERGGNSEKEDKGGGRVGEKKNEDKEGERRKEEKG